METVASPVLAQRAASEGPRWTRAVGDQSVTIPKERTSELGWSLIYGRWSFDVRSWGLIQATPVGKRTSRLGGTIYMYCSSDGRTSTIAGAIQLVRTRQSDT